MRRRFNKSVRRLEDFLIRFYPAGTYTWVVPDGCTEVDVFLVGAGGGTFFVDKWGASGGGGGGYTKTFRGKGYVKPSSGTWMGSETEGRDGDAIAVTPGQSIQIIVGAGIAGKDGGFSQFANSNYRADGGNKAYGWTKGGKGGSGGGTSLDSNGKEANGNGGSDGGNGGNSRSGYGKGQGHTTRDFGEPGGKRNAGGGSSIYKIGVSFSSPGVSDYVEGSGPSVVDSVPGWMPGAGGGGYGGGAGTPFDNKKTSLPGGDGTVLIRGKQFKQ